mgnify:FL=1
MELKRFLTTETGKVIISPLLGLGLATLFRKNCNDEECISFQAPSLEDIENKTYKYGNRCFKYNMNSIPCDKDKTMVNFA